MANLFRRKEANDMLEQKKKKLNTYVEEFDTAVSIITNTIDVLTSTSSNIEQTIVEIDEWLSLKRKQMKL